jgi:shikimate dehydrogenase
MDIYGLVGKTLSHSKSPDYFNKRFRDAGINAEYRLFEIDDVEELKGIINETPNLKGLNVTIPYKRSLSFLINCKSKEVAETGSLNTIRIARNKQEIITTAYNTDIIGFEKSIKASVVKNPRIKALILGTGGAAHTAAYVFRKLGVFFYFVSRKASKVEYLSYNSISKEILNEFHLIINTTPLGMFPNVDTAPDLPYEHINSKHICFDAVYNPKDTLFLKRAKLNGATVITGKEMFEIQAESAWNIWFKK